MRSALIYPYYYSGGSEALQLASTFKTRVEADGGVVEAEDCLKSRLQNLETLGLLSKASAVWLPHGYKEGKLYAVKGGSGADLGFTRAGTRTRKGPTYVEQVPYNLIPNSVDMSGIGWAGTNTTITANSITAPDGTLTGSLLTEAVGIAAHLWFAAAITTAVFGGRGQCTFSTHLKAGTRQYLAVSVINAGGFGVVFDTISGTIVGTGASGSSTYESSSVEAVGDGWYKVSVTGQFNEIGQPSPRVVSHDSSVWSIQPSSSGSLTYYMWGACFNVGDIKDFFFTTNRFNVPALDYTNDTCPALSLEPSRTNLLLRSGEFDNASWTKNFTTITADNIIGPSGLSNADKVLETVDNQHHYIQQSFSKATSTQPASITIFFKYLGRQWVSIWATDGTSNTIRQWFDIQNGVVGTSSQAGTTYTKTGASIKGFGNGWYRCEFNIQVADVLSSVALSYRSSAGDGNTSTFVGDITKGFYGFGAQVEIASYATSYIPTTSATVTRIADAVDALTGISSLIGQTEGTIYWEGIAEPKGSLHNILSLYNSASANADNIVVHQLNDSGIQFAIRTGNLSQVSMVYSMQSGVLHKLAVTYQGNKASLFIDGVLKETDLSCTIPACNAFDRSLASPSSHFEGYDNTIVLSNIAISDAEAIALTTP